MLTLDPASQANLPEGLDGSRFRWVDLDGEGLSGILSDAGGGLVLQAESQRRPTWSRSRTARSPPRPRFGPLETVAGLPSRSDLSGGHGCSTSPAAAASTSSTFRAPTRASSSGRRDGGFEPLQRFAALPDARLVRPEPQVRRPHRRRAGRRPDHRGRAVHRLRRRSGESGLRRGAAGPARLGRGERAPASCSPTAPRPSSPPTCPGDGLSDIVRVRNGEVCYWPNTRLRPVRGQGDDGPRAALRRRGAVRPAPDPAGRHRRIGHRRPALRRRRRRDRLVQPVRQRLVRADQHRACSPRPTS